MKTGIKIVNVEYVGDYKLAISFSDKKKNVFDYKPFVTYDHEEFKPYLDVTRFKKFKIVDNNTSIAWGKDWEMILPLHTLYSKKTARFHSSKN